MKADVDLTRLETLLYYAAKSIGLAPFTITKNKLLPATRLGKAYALVVAIVFTAWIACVYYNKTSPVTSTSLHRLIGLGWALSVIFVVISGMITFAIKSEKIVNLKNQMNVIDDKLREVITKGWFHRGISNKIAEKIFKSNCVIFLLKILFELSYLDEFIINWNPFVTIWSFLFSFYLHNIILIFVQTLLWVRQRFEYLNKNLRDVLRPNLDPAHSLPDLPTRRIFVVGRRGGNDDPERQDNVNESPNIQSTVKRIKDIEQLHEELRQTAKFATRLFTMPIVFILYHHVLIMILLFYQAHTFPPLHGYKNLGPTLYIILRFIPEPMMIVYNLVSIANACVSISKEGRATRSVLDDVWNEYRPTELKDQFIMFSFKLIHNEPLTISAFEFFNLDYSCILQILSAVIAHAVLVMQFEPSRQN